MHSVVLQADDFTVSVPQTTSGQYVLAATVLFVLSIAGIVWYWRSKTFGLEDDQKANREEARAQKRRQTPAVLQYPSTALKKGIDGLYSDVDSLFDQTDDPKSTRTTVVGALREVYRSVAVAWFGRVEGIPRLARRGLWLAAWVAITGAIAVSTGAVVNLLSSEPTAPSLGQVLDSLRTGAENGVDVVGAFPYGGTLWTLGYAYAILAVQWLYDHWWLVAGGLCLSAVSLIVLDRRLDESEVPDRVLKNRVVASVVAIASVALVWFVGTAVAVIGNAVSSPLVFGVSAVPLAALVVTVVLTIYLGYHGYLSKRQLVTAAGVMAAMGVSAVATENWADLLGLLLAGVTALGLASKLLPVALLRVRAGIHDVAGVRSRAAAGYLVSQRVLSILSVAGAALVAMYAIAGVSGGQFVVVAEAFLQASTSVQTGVGLAVVATVGLVLYSVAGAWPDVKAALHAAFAQQAVRAQVFRRALPGFVVFLAYVSIWALSNRILISLGLALVAGLVFRLAVRIATEAAYRADGRQIWKRLIRPEPMYVSWLAYEINVAGETFYLLEVNGRKLVSGSQSDVVQAAVDVGIALATNEEPPVTGESWFAEFLFDRGIADRDDWDAKLDEKVREEVFDTLRDEHLPIIGRRSTGGRVTRDAFDRELDEFPDERVQSRLYDKDIYPFVAVGDQYVSLETDPYRTADRPQWPSFEG